MIEHEEAFRQIKASMGAIPSKPDYVMCLFTDASDVHWWCYAYSDSSRLTQTTDPNAGARASSFSQWILYKQIFYVLIRGVPMQTLKNCRKTMCR
jgi:hypothetical protein